MIKKLIKLMLFLTVFLVASCTKEVPKELLEKQNTQKQLPNEQQMPDDSIHRNLKQNTETETKGDPKAEEMTAAADDAEAKYIKSKSETDKKTCIQKELAAANYLMFEANLSPKKKYRPALQRYRRVLELDPNNAEAMENKKQIEDIYKSMGMPVPD